MCPDDLFSECIKAIAQGSSGPLAQGLKEISEPIENESTGLMRNLIHPDSTFCLPFIWFLREVMFVG